MIFTAFILISHLRPFPRKTWQVLSTYFASLDPNWASADIDFDHNGQPVSATLNGPKNGTVSFLEKFIEFFQGELADDMTGYFAPMMGYVKSFGMNFSLRNPDHHLELISNQTVIYFGNCERGLVQNFDHLNQVFEIRGRDHYGSELVNWTEESYPMSVREFLWEMAEAQIEQWTFGPVFIEYLQPNTPETPC